MAIVLGNFNITTNGSGMTSDSVAVLGALSTSTAAATSDLLAPALDLKAPKDNPIFTGTVRGVTARMVTSSNGDVQSDINELQSRNASNIPSIPSTPGAASNVQSDLTSLRQADTALGARITNLTASNIKTSDPARSVQDDITLVADQANKITPTITGGITLSKNTEANEDDQFLKAGRSIDNQSKQHHCNTTA